MMLESDLLPAEILGTSTAAAELREFVRQAASDEVPVLLGGEPGTGKQHTARVIHEQSRRARDPLLMIDCSLYYERELKRELFGYGGASAAGKERQGILEFASRGTCYLSNVEEISPSIQDGLIRFLKTGRVTRLGDGEDVRSEARLVLSSEKNVEGFVRAGLVSRELFDCVAHRHTLQPLRARAADIPAILDALVAAKGSGGAPGECVDFSAEVLDALECYPWPANLDELCREVSRLLDGGWPCVRTEHLSMEISSYWLGQRGDPQTRRVLEELDGYIREFKILSRIGCDFGESAPGGVTCFGVSGEESERDLLEEY